MDLDTHMHYCNFHTIFVKCVVQARQARSGVAGLFSWKGPVRPASFRAAVTASLIAKNTELPRNNVGSPIPYNKRDIAPQKALVCNDVTSGPDLEKQPLKFGKKSHKNQN